MNISQIFVGVCVALDRKTSASGTSYTILTLTAPCAYKKKGEDKHEWFEIQFTLFGRVAHSVETQFREGDIATVWYDLGTRTKGQYTNINLSVRRVVIHPDDNAQDAPRTAPRTAEASTPRSDAPPRETPFRAAKTRTDTDDDHPPF